jgi:hypothetical protein
LRLADGVAPATAVRDLSRIQQHLASTYAEHGTEWTTADFQPLSWEFVGASAPALETLAGAAVLVLLVACVNVATLLLLRAFAREREFAIRAALGASHFGVARLTLTESALLGCVAAGVALLLTWWGLALVRGMAADTIPRSAELRLDARVAGLVVALALVATTIIAWLRSCARFGDTPSSRCARVAADVRRTWRESVAFGARFHAGSHGTHAPGGRGLLIQSFRRLSDVDLGFDPRHLASF